MSNSPQTRTEATAVDPAQQFAPTFLSAARPILGPDLQAFMPAATAETAGEFLCSCQDARYALRAGEGGDAWAWCDIEPALALAMASRLLGCIAAEAPLCRPLTAVEVRLVARVAEAAAQAGAGSSAWRAKPLPRSDDRRSDHPLTILRLGLTLGRASGVLRLAVPAALGASSPPTDAGSTGLVEVRVTTQDFEVSEEALAGLDVGDVLAVDLPADGEVIIRVAGVPKFAARLGQHQGRRAVIVTRKLF